MNIHSNYIMANMFLPGRSWGLNTRPTHADDRVTRGAIDPLNYVPLDSRIRSGVEPVTSAKLAPTPVAGEAHN